MAIGRRATKENAKYEGRNFCHDGCRTFNVNVKSFDDTTFKSILERLSQARKRKKKLKHGNIVFGRIVFPSQ
jgi:hypothetical protein